MKNRNKKYGKPDGSALILVVVVTVLLAVVGVMFLMVSRASELEAGAVVQSADLDNAVDSVVAKINEVLVEDLFGNDSTIVNGDGTDEPYDAVNTRDPWLASLEPYVLDDLGDTDPTNDIYAWARITDLYGTGFLFANIPPVYYDPQDDSDQDQRDGSQTQYKVDATDTLVKVIAPKDRTKVILQGASGTASIPDPWDDETQTFPYGARADADGDGVADSRWVQIPGLTTSRGEPVFAAVRIIDNCAMLNLNAAHCFYQEPHDEPTPLYVDTLGNPVSTFSKPWFYDGADYTAGTLFHDNQSGSGRYLTEINYLPFLRGSDLNGDFFGAGAGDDWYNLMIARGFYKLDASNNIIPFSFSPWESQSVLRNIENPVTSFQFFDIGDELELRNRYLVTSKVEARLERADVANFSLDSGSTDYAALQVPRDNSSNTIDIWKERVDPANFDAWSMWTSPTGGSVPYKYDRRHVCTVYSYDRMFRRGDYTLLDGELDTLAIAAGWTLQQKEQAKTVFWPTGPVTTDIAVPVYVETFLGSGVWKWQNNTNNIETRRKILHLLFAFREYFLPDNYWGLLPAEQDVEKQKAAVKAAQVVANLIDYSDDNSDNTGAATDTQGPFYDAAYGSQANADCTFITSDIINSMITEVSTALGAPIPGFDFGFPAGQVLFGYEKQPFISEVAADWNGLPANAGDPYLEAFGVELVNPYMNMINLKDWQIKIGSNPPKALNSFNTSQGDVQWQIPGATAPDALGYMVLHRTQQALGSINYAPGGVIITDPITDFDGIYGIWSGGGSLEIQLLRPAPTWVSNNLGIDYIIADRLSNDDVRSVMETDGVHSLQRGEGDWDFVYGKYASVITPASSPYVLGEKNTQTTNVTGFQIGVADDELGLCRWHELETLGLYGNGPETTDPNDIRTVPSQLANLDPNEVPYFDLAGDSSDLLDYIATINRPDIGSMPGRININTAPVHVIAAAIPPTLADPNAADPAETVAFSALQLAEEIVKGRPYQKISDLLNIPAFKQYVGSPRWADPNVANVGAQSIEDDIEEEHWILSNLANKFTVRSDVFTAYILVRLGAEGPQRRMIGIFDRSGVWEPTDRPKLVALHPVPDPR